MQEKPQVNAFINFYLTHVNDEVIDVGYFPASEVALAGALDSWRIANGMAPIGDDMDDEGESSE